MVAEDVAMVMMEVCVGGMVIVAEVEVAVETDCRHGVIQEGVVCMGKCGGDLWHCRVEG